MLYAKRYPLYAKKSDILTRQDQFERRIKIFWIIIICGLLVLLGRIAWLQLIEGERYFRISKNSRLRLVPLPCSRGLILDRNGEKLAGNEAFFSVGVVPSNVTDIDELIKCLDEFLDIDKEIAKKRIQEANNIFRPVWAKRNIDLSAVTYLLEKEEDFPGTVILTQPVRSYYYDEMCAHVLGHVGEVNQEELTANSTFGVELGDLVGKMGVEKAYNSYLQGEKGGRQVEVDAHGRTLRVISEKDPLPGDSVYLTIDLEMQEIAAEKLGQRKGVVLIGDYETGEILTLVSHPTFNPNLFSWGVSEDEWSKLVQDPGDPLENRALRGEYPPASTFKVVVAAAALEDNIIGKEDTFFCGGELLVGNRIFKCWKEEGHGRLNLEEAIIDSCDVFFYQLGLKIGMDKIIRYSRLFELGEITGIDPVSEKDGLLPTREWKLKAKGEAWYPGDTVNLSIGQGFLLVTPVQMFRVIAAVANGGSLIDPYLVKEVVDSQGKVVESFSPGRGKKIPISSSVFDFLGKSLRGVVREGTGWRAENKIVKIAGKTGTAESSDEERPHNWFIGYTLPDDARLAIVVLIEYREEEISIAAQIAGEILSQIFNKN
ncbi:penicillin-binding protein 2 [Candidatus Aerophobetes bacterium Ae_b3a]|nr:MAG: penicillin-binding protein 2 [Candidatus Aerophobetes bacterium Ae_b3a]